MADLERGSSFSASSLYRHRARHMSATILGERRASEDFGSIDLLDALVDTLRDVAAVRGHALSTGNPSMLLRSAATSERIIAALMAHLGSDDAEVLSLLKSGDMIAKAVAEATRANPEVGAQIAAALDGQQDAGELASGLRRFATTVALASEGKDTK